MAAIKSFVFARGRVRWSTGPPGSFQRVGIEEMRPVAGLGAPLCGRVVSGELTRTRSLRPFSRGLEWVMFRLPAHRGVWQISSQFPTK
jgi:hypothetical protein